MLDHYDPRGLSRHVVARSAHVQPGSGLHYCKVLLFYLESSLEVSAANKGQGYRVNLAPNFTLHSLVSWPHYPTKRSDEGIELDIQPRFASQIISIPNLPPRAS